MKTFVFLLWFISQSVADHAEVHGPDIYKTERTETTVTAFWNRVSVLVQKYKVCIISDENVKPENCNGTIVNGTAIKGILTNLVAYTDYNIVVTALNDGNYGPFGNNVKVKTACTKKTQCRDNNAICLGGNCICEDGYIRDEEGGNCRGITCEDSPCGGIGICKPLSNEKKKFDCECPAGTTGDGYRCYETPCYSSPCLNGGSCELDKSNAQNYSCACPIGYSGDRCEQMNFPCMKEVGAIPYCDSDEKTCDENTCKRGTCEPMPAEKKCSKYFCHCNDGFVGRNCEIEITDCLTCTKTVINELEPTNTSNDQRQVETETDQFKCTQCLKVECEKSPGTNCDVIGERQSYLHFPRIHFSGSLQADPSTLNNYADNFDTLNFPGETSGWNPPGSATWRLLDDVIVTRVCYSNELCTTSENDDQIINTIIKDGNIAVSAKLVDLDVEFQSSSEIYGWSLKVDEFFKGDFQRVGFQYMWKKMKGVSGGMRVYGSVYQSILTNVQFGTRSQDSVIVKYLKDTLTCNGINELSIRFNIDMYDNYDKSNNFTYARIVGSIGLSGKKSPPYFTFGRMLKPISYPNFWFSPFVLDGESLFIDLGNSLAIKEDGSVVNKLGKLALGLLEQGTSKLAPKCSDVKKWIPRATKIDINDFGGYARTAGIFHIPVTSLVGNKGHLENSRVILAQLKNDGRCKEVVLAEDKNGIDIHPFSRWTLRTVPDKEVTVDLFMAEYGKIPDNPNTFSIKLAPSAELNPSTFQFIADGTVTVKMVFPDPNHVRHYIDGKVYIFDYFLSTESSSPDFFASLNSEIAVLVWDKFVIPVQPNWIRHVQPILKQYANLYPVMKMNFLDLSNYYEVVENKEALKRTMSLDKDDPRYMPVTRDLSPNKTAMILNWLKNDKPVLGFSNLGININTLKYLLQTALQLEHATIPPYLTGYLSIKKGYNTEVKGMLKKILIDEMHHLAQVSNILNAVDGNPSLLASHFVLPYPSYLPGGVHPDIKITVNKISVLQIRNVYMAIEQPSKELEETGLMKAIDEVIQEKLYQSYSKTCSAQGCPDNEDNDGCGKILTLYNAALRKQENIHTNHNTIGELYTVILIVMAKLECDNELIFSGTRSQIEVTGTRGNEVIKVSDFKTATQALMNIIEEGEGSSPCNPLDDNSDLSHYYKFASIANKRHLKSFKKEENTTSVHQEEAQNECGGGDSDTFAYTGSSLPFNEDGVWPIVDNPIMSMYKKGSKALHKAKSFSSTYWKLLHTLQNVFDGNTFLFDDTIGVMKELLMRGNGLVQTPIDENGDPLIGPNAGPIYPTEQPVP